MINKLIEEKQLLATKYKQAMEMSQRRSEKANKYDLTEILNAECSVSFNKAHYFALIGEIKDLEELKKELSKENVAFCGLRYGKTKVQVEQIKKYIEENSLTEIKITILDSESKQKLDEIEEYIKDKACYDEKTKECKCSFSSMALDNILSIIGDKDEK